MNTPGSCQVFGRHEEARRAADRVGELDPNNADLRARSAAVYLMAQDYNRARVLLSEAMTLDPTFFWAALHVGAEEARRGDYPEAVRLFQRAEELMGPVESGFTLAFLSYGYGLTQSPEDAMGVFERIESLSQERRVGPLSWAYAYPGIGEQGEALESLTAAANQREPDEGSFFRIWWKRNHVGDPALEQPEFVEVRSRLGFGD